MKTKLRTVPLRIMLSDKEHKQLKTYSKRNDMFMAEVTREFLFKGLKGLCKDSIKYDRSGKI